MKSDTEKSTVTVGDSNTLFLVIDKTRRQKISKVVEGLNNTVNRLESNWHSYNGMSKNNR